MESQLKSVKIRARQYIEIKEKRFSPRWLIKLGQFIC